MQTTTTTMTPELEAEWTNYVRGLTDREPRVNIHAKGNVHLIDLSEEAHLHTP